MQTRHLRPAVGCHQLLASSCFTAEREYDFRRATHAARDRGRAPAQSGRSLSHRGTRSSASGPPRTAAWKRSTAAALGRRPAERSVCGTACEAAELLVLQVKLRVHAHLGDPDPHAHAWDTEDIALPSGPLIGGL